MALSYPELRPAGINKYSYISRNKSEFTWGGRITENIIQALARIVITDGIARIATYMDRIGGRVVLTVHDEIVCVAPETDANNVMDTIIELMCIAPTWAPDLPLAAEGGYDKAYSK
jgi:DNA polymerase